MAYYQITFACGCKDSVQLYGKGSEREWKQQSMAQRLCPECAKAAEERERMEASERAAELNRDYGCDALDGSPAQVAWAETLRCARIAALQSLTDASQERAGNLGGNPLDGAIFEFLVATLQWAKRISSAKWWIDNRDSYREEGPDESMRAILAMASRRPSRPRDLSLVELAKGLMLLSPHMTEKLAEACGLRERWLVSFEAQRKLESERERLASHNAAREAARALGLKGGIRVWSSADGDHRRIYADGFTYFHAGKDAGKLDNNTAVADESLRPFCERLCKSWSRLSFYA